MKNVKIIAIVLLVSTLLTSMTSCFRGNYNEVSSSESNLGKNTVKENEKEGEDNNDDKNDEWIGRDKFVYYDNGQMIIHAGNLEVCFFDIDEEERDNNTVTITLKIKNISTTIQECSISNMRMVRESTNASYTVYNQIFESSNFDLESEIIKTVRLISTTPSSFESEKYYFEFELNRNTIRFYLYFFDGTLIYESTEEPTEEITEYVPKTMKIAYKVDGQVIATDERLENEINNRYVWYSEDGLYYCIDWSRKYSGNSSFDVILEGAPKSIIKFSTTSSDVYTFARQLNYDDVYPQNGTLVIPTEFEGKPVCISPYFFSISMTIAGVKTVYIGNVKKIYSQNLANTSIKTIYFAGTKEQWDAYGLDVPSKITVIYNTPYSK